MQGKTELRKYVIVRAKSLEGFSEGIRELADLGRKVVSAGSMDGTYWAIMENPEEEKSVPEEVKEAGKRAELLEAARVIAEHCRAHGNNCDGCALWSNECGCVAMVVGSGCTPDNWPIGEGRTDDV